MRCLVLLLLVLAGLPAFEARDGDLVFQSLPHGALVDAIETATRSPYSHCGIAVDGGARVLEAIGPVKETPYAAWVAQGRGGRITVCRLLDPALVPGMIAAGRTFLGRPYDLHYRLDDERIYCSELLYKAVLAAHGLRLVAPTRLRDLRWERILPVIAAIEGTEVPLDREIVTPVSLVYSRMVRVVYSDYNR